MALVKTVPRPRASDQQPEREMAGGKENQRFLRARRTIFVMKRYMRALLLLSDPGVKILTSGTS